MFNYHGDYNWRQNISGAPELFWPVGILFVLGIVLAIWFIVRYARKKYVTAENEKLFPLFGILFTFAWLAFGILPAAASDEGIPHALRSILAIPPAIILAALGGVWLYRLLKKHWNVMLVKTLAGIFVIVVIGWAYYDYFIVWAQNPNVPGAFSANYVDIGRQINALPASTQKYVIINAGGGRRSRHSHAGGDHDVHHAFVHQSRRDRREHPLHRPRQCHDGHEHHPRDTPSADIFYIN